jgi:hypothetical protein
MAIGCLCWAATSVSSITRHGRPQPARRPEAEVAINGTEIPVTATLLTDRERDRALQRFLAYPMYKSYRTRTDRELRVFALSRR